MGKTATKVKDLTGWGMASLYELSESVETYDGERKTKFVIVSAVNAMFSGPETLVFAARQSGEKLGMLIEIGGGRGYMNHTKALENMGFTIKDGGI